MSEKIVAILEIGHEGKYADIEIPLDITANQLIEILNSVYFLEKEKEAGGISGFYCQRPAVFLKGDRKLSEFGLRNGVLLKAADGKHDMEQNEEPIFAVSGSYPEFIRNTRIKTVISEEEIQILNPTERPQKNTTSLLLSLIPAMGMLALIIVLRGVMGNGGTYIIFSVCSMCLGVVTSCIGYFGNKNKYRKKLKEREETYRRYIEQKQQEVETARDKEREGLKQIYYSAEKEYDMVKNFSSNLFERSPKDADFLHICLGIGELPSRRRISCKMPEKLELDDAIEAIPGKMQEAYKKIENVPITFPMCECNAVGIVGNDVQQFIIFKRILLDICTRHFSTDVNIYIITADENASLLKDIRLLPHLQNTILNIRNIGCDSESRNIIFEYLYKRLSEKEMEKTTLPWDIIFIYDECGIKKHPVSGYISKAAGLGVGFFFFEKRKEELPQGCSKIINMESEEGKGVLINSRNREDYTIFHYEIISDIVMKEVTKILAPIHAQEVGLENSMTKKVSLYEMYHVNSIDEVILEKTWNESKIYETMAAPIGLGSKDKLIFLDIHEKMHGPHGLVAGTTGAGKSELLQTYVISMALNYPPNEVGFVMIDFKGGGMANQFSNLPHLVGSITNIDEKSMARSLKSIQAELKKRQEIFAEAGVNHIDTYIKERLQHKERRVLPHLIIIVDEFAELKAQQPEFMKELISAARIGRSLGIHLILATQKPSGQVNEQIWSNSRFKMCLKVQNKNDSNEVLKSPLAAEIKEPGRCYLQVGNNEIFELFQSAFSGEIVDEDKEKEQMDICISEVALSGKRKTVFEQKQKKEIQESHTQLENAIEYIAEYVKNNNMECSEDICLPELKERIEFPDRGADMLCGAKKGIIIEIGIADDPERQRQTVIHLNISEKNTMIIGSAQTGKTNLLLTIVRSITEKYTPQEVNFYVIDFASMILKNFENIHHCGGIVCSNEDEKLKNLFKLLFQMLEERRERMLAVGVSSFRAYREAGYTDLPYIILIVDNLTALKELYLNNDDSLIRLSREGIAVGISIIVANPQTAGIGYKYLSNFAERIAFFCNDATEYSTLFEQGKQTLSRIQGRCLIENERRVLESQIFIPFSGEREIERINAMCQYVEIKNTTAKGKAVRIPIIPKVITMNYLEQQFQIERNPYTIPCGLNYATVMPFYLQLDKIGVLPLVGGEENIQRNFVKNICMELEKQKADAEIIIFDEPAGSYKELEKLSVVKERIETIGSMNDVITVLEQQMKERYEKCRMNQEALQREKLKMIVIGNTEAAEYLSKEKEIISKYNDIITKYISMKVCFIWTGIANSSIPYNAPEVYKKMKEEKKFFIFEDVNNIKVTDISLVLAKKFKKPIDKEDVYFVHEGALEKIKLLTAIEKSQTLQ